MFGFLKRRTTTEHDRCQQNLSAYLDGRLPGGDCARVQRHLQGCAACRAEMASLRQTVALLNSVPDLKPPRPFFLPVSEAARHRQVRRHRMAYGFLQLSTSAATVLLVLVMSGDALLRVQRVSRPAPLAGAKLAAPSNDATEAAPLLAMESDEGSRADEAEPDALSAAGAASVAATEKSPQTPEVAESLALGSATQEPAALPSLTYARPAAPPAPHTAAPEPTAEPMATASPTSVPQPTATVPPVVATMSPIPTPERSLQPASAELDEPGIRSPSGWTEFLESVQPLLPRIEVVLASAVGVLLMAMVWLRSRLKAL